MRTRPVLSNLTDTRPRNRIRERDRNESPPTLAVHESRVTSVLKDPRSNWAMPLLEATGWGDHGSGVEVNGSAVSVPRGESPTTGLRIAASSLDPGIGSARMPIEPRRRVDGKGKMDGAELRNVEEWRLSQDRGGEVPSWIRAAMSPVHPVWCDAPTPRPVSPWKSS
jgi:hypothetical protein